MLEAKCYGTGDTTAMGGKACKGGQRSEGGWGTEADGCSIATAREDRKSTIGKDATT